MLVFLFLSSSGCNAELGGFAGLFDLKAAGFVDPILVAGTDGVGTKLKVLTISLHPACALFSELKENNGKKQIYFCPHPTRSHRHAASTARLVRTWLPCV